MDPITPIIYLRLRKKVRIAEGQPILLGQVAHLLAEPELEGRLKQVPLHTSAELEGNMILVDMLEIVRKLKEIAPEAEVEYIGEPQTIVEIVPRARKPARWWALVLAWILLFLGSGLTIMNFHTDVSMPEVHRKLYEMITGRKSAQPLMIQIPYSFGIGAGMILFFNRLFRRKFNEEPNPLEVEMFNYEESVRQFIIDDEFKKKNDRVQGK